MYQAWFRMCYSNDLMVRFHYLHLQMRNTVLREGNIFAQGRTVSRWQSQD